MKMSWASANQRYGVNRSSVNALEERWQRYSLYAPARHARNQVDKVVLTRIGFVVAQHRAHQLRRDRGPAAELVGIGSRTALSGKSKQWFGTDGESSTGYPDARRESLLCSMIGSNRVRAAAAAVARRRRRLASLCAAKRSAIRRHKSAMYAALSVKMARPVRRAVDGAMVGVVPVKSAVEPGIISSPQMQPDAPPHPDPNTTIWSGKMAGSLPSSVAQLGG